jgi:hypothetical protein
MDLASKGSALPAGVADTQSSHDPEVGRGVCADDNSRSEMVSKHNVANLHIVLADDGNEYQLTVRSSIEKELHRNFSIEQSAQLLVPSPSSSNGTEQYLFSLSEIPGLRTELHAPTEAAAELTPEEEMAMTDSMTSDMSASGRNPMLCTLITYRKRFQQSLTRWTRLHSHSSSWLDQYTARAECLGRRAKAIDAARQHAADLKFQAAQSTSSAAQQAQLVNERSASLRANLLGAVQAARAETLHPALKNQSLCSLWDCVSDQLRTQCEQVLSLLASTEAAPAMVRNNSEQSLASTDSHTHGKRGGSTDFDRAIFAEAEMPSANSGSVSPADAMNELTPEQQIVLSAESWVGQARAVVDELRETVSTLQADMDSVDNLYSLETSTNLAHALIEVDKLNERHVNEWSPRIPQLAARMDALTETLYKAHDEFDSLCRTEAAAVGEAQKSLDRAKLPPQQSNPTANAELEASVPDLISTLEAIGNSYKLWLAEIPRRRCFDLKFAASTSSHLSAQQRLREGECQRREQFWNETARLLPSVLAIGAQELPPQVPEYNADFESELPLIQIDPDVRHKETELVWSVTSFQPPEMGDGYWEMTDLHQSDLFSISTAEEDKSPIEPPCLSEDTSAAPSRDNSSAERDVQSPVEKSEAEQQIVALQTRLQLLEVETSKLTAAIATGREHESELWRQIRDKDSKIHEAKETEAQLKSELKAALAKCVELEGQDEERDFECTRLEQENHELRQAVQDLKDRAEKEQLSPVNRSSKAFESKEAAAQEWDAALPRRSRSTSDPAFVREEDSSRRVAELEGMVNMIVGRISQLEGSVCNMSTASLSGSITSSTSALMTTNSLVVPHEKTRSTGKAEGDGALSMENAVKEGSTAFDNGSFLSCVNSVHNSEAANAELSELREQLATSTQLNTALHEKLQQYQKGLMVTTVALMQLTRQNSPLPHLD